LIAEAARRAEPRAVDLSGCSDILSIDEGRNILSHLRSDHFEPPEVCLKLHGKVTICHSAIDLRTVRLRI
jgi:hypothetical protein